MLITRLLYFLGNSWLALLLAVVIAYLLGSVNFAIIITKLFSGKDIRNFGSGNAGMTNVLRSQGKLPAALTFIGDLLKSILAVSLGGFLLQHLQLSPATPAEIPMELLMYDMDNLRLVGRYAAGVACILGHLHPLYFGFRGGKGVVTTFGMMILLDWRTALIMLGVFLVVLLIWRMVSLGSIVAGVFMPFLTYIMGVCVDRQDWETALFCAAVTALIAVIVIVKHRENIKRIFNGTESKLGKKKG